MLPRALAQVPHLSGSRRIVGQKAFRQSDGAQPQAEEAEGICWVGHRQFDAAAPDVDKKSKGQVETKPAHDAQADQARLVLLGQNLQRNTDRLGAADKLSPVGCFAQRARAGCPDSSDPMLVRGGFKILQHTQRRFDRLRLELAVLEYFAAKANGLPVLSDDPIVFGMIDRGNLPTHGIGADIDNCKMMRHASFLPQTPSVITNDTDLAAQLLRIH